MEKQVMKRNLEKKYVKFINQKIKDFIEDSTFLDYYIEDVLENVHPLCVSDEELNNISMINYNILKSFKITIEKKNQILKP